MSKNANEEEKPASVESRLQSLLAGWARSRGGWVPMPRLRCADGFSLSVQASKGSYCEPRSDEGPWESVEVGYPSRIEPLLWPYAESPGDWTATVYPWVPVALVAAVVEVHGGLAGEGSP